MPLKDVFSEITRQTKLYFLGSSDKLNQNELYTIKVENETVNKALTELLGAKGFIWIIKDNTVLIQKSNENDTKVGAMSSNVTAADSLIIVTGKVVNEKGDPIPGATVLIKGTQLGTTTTSDGTFKISAVKPNSAVVITSIAYLTKEFLLRGKGNIGAIELEEYVGVLDEAQVIAYGTTSRRLNTGNVGTVKSSDIEKQPVNNPLLALAGRIPGLQITQANGIAGGGVKVLIQGQNSLSYGNDPFYVIDGVPYTSQLLPNLGNILGTSQSAGLSEGNNGNPLSFINPQDIESIEVLKDADATAIYGSRAGNGAILITTKKGKAGPTRLDFNLQTGIGEVTRKLDLLNTRQYLQMRKEAKKNDNASILATDYDINGTWDTARNTNWQKELIGGTAKYNDGQITLSGGSSTTQFLIGGNYHKETTVYMGDLSDQKGSFHFNINNVSQNNRFRVSLSGSYMADDNKLISTDFTQLAMTLPSNAPELYKTDGSINWEPNSNGIATVQPNSQAAARLKRKYTNNTTNLISNLMLSFEIVGGLELSSSFGYTNMQSKEILYLDLPSAYPPELQHFFSRKVQFGDNNIKSWIVEPQINYKAILGPGRISILVGSTIQQRNNNRQLLEATGFNDDLVMDNINAATSVIVPPNSTIYSIYKYNAVFGRLNYNIEDKYILNITARRDGSSRFGSENRFHNFGAIGATWIFTNERFVKSNVPFLSFGKLRGSFGTTGNDQIGDYSFMSLYDNINPAIPYRGVGGLTPRNIANPYLQWEETKKLQIGLELGFAHDKIILNSTYFRNRSSNQLLPYSLPLATGVSSIISNFPATIQNSGWELALTSVNVTRKYFTWSTSLNFTLPRNKLVKYEDLSTSSYSNVYLVGEPFTTTRLYKYNGVNSSTGVYEFIDKDGKSIQNPTNNALNKTVIVNTSQRFYGGISNTLSYKGFQLDFLFQFVKQMGINNFFGNNVGGRFVNQPSTVLNRWQQSGDNSSIQKYNSNNSLISSQIAVRQSDGAWKDASYIRLKNLSLSWQIPEFLEKRLKLNGFRIFVQGQNLLTVTKYIGLDPETLSSSTLPPLRVITFGINTTL